MTVPFPQRVRAFDNEIEDVEVWLANLDLTTDVVYQYAAFLCVDERERARRFHFERDRRRFITARGILRSLLGTRLGVAPHAIKFAQTEKGKPLAVNGGTHFNVSHSHERVLIAMSAAKPVGVDIEYLAREVNHAALASRYFTSEERAAIQSLPESQRRDGFLTCWTCKEAIAKARGEGLFLSLDSFEITLLPTLTVSQDINGYTLRATQIEADYVAAVAVSIN